MPWVSYVDPENQFGPRDVTLTRPGEVRSALWCALAAHLLKNKDDSADRLKELSVRFKELLADVDPCANKKSSKWKQALFTQVIAAMNQSPAGIYLTALHCLLWRLAGGPLVERDLGNPDDEGEDVEDVPDPDNGDDDGFGCLDHELRWDLGRILAREFAPTLRCDEDELDEDAQLVAEVLLEALFETLPPGLNCKRDPVSFTGEDGKPRDAKKIVLTNRELIAKLKTTLALLPYHLTFQPLKRPPCYEEERQYTPIPPQALIGYHGRNEFIREFHRSVAVKKEYVDAVNAQQRVAWRINCRVLDVARQLRSLVRGENTAPKDDPMWIHQRDLGSDLTEGWRNWSVEEFYRAPPEEGPRRSYEKPGELLDNFAAAAVLKELAPDSGPCQAFWLAWRADYRGRIYARTPWLTPQGSDLQRALLEFADGTKLDDSGVVALKRHGANLVKRETIRKDLRIAGREVLTLAERERWVEENATRICEFAMDPLVNVAWREISDKPLQFLAFCFAYHRYRDAPTEPCHLPVQIDGTCNGLQHIAALTGDDKLARAVNVLPNPDDMPGDIYSEVAQVARQSEEKPHLLQSLFLKIQKDLPKDWAAEWFDRNLAKKVIMTVPYGASEISQIKAMQEKVAKLLDRELENDCSRREAWLAVARSLVKPALVSPGFVKKLLREFERALARALRGFPQGSVVKQRRDVKDSAPKEWRGLATLVAVLSSVIVRRVRDALESGYPAALRFEKELKKIGSACAGLPLAWSSPLGFPVCQDKFYVHRTSVNAKLGSKPVKIEVSKLTEVVVSGAKKTDAATKASSGKKSLYSKSNQTSALLPNLIHSLDATHLMRTINAAAKSGIARIGSIHDCLLCHPNEAQQLGTLLRQEFADMYKRGNAKPKVLEEWEEWMRVLSLIARCGGTPALHGALEVTHVPPVTILTDEPLELFQHLRAMRDPARASWPAAERLLNFRKNLELTTAKKPLDKGITCSKMEIENVKKSQYFFC